MAPDPVDPDPVDPNPVDPDAVDPGAVDRDPVDRVVAQWRTQRPDLAGDLEAMALIGRLGRLHALASRSIEEVFTGHRLTTAEFDVLATLRRQGDPFQLTPSAIARSLMLSPAGMTNRVDRLAERGLVERVPDPEDRRSIKVGLTPSGLEVVDAAVGDHLANEVRILSSLTVADRRELDRIVRRLLASFDVADPA